jgi:hypothetical protein
LITDVNLLAIAASTTTATALNESAKVDAIIEAECIFTFLLVLIESSRAMLSGGSTAVSGDLNVGPTSAVSVVRADNPVSAMHRSGSGDEAENGENESEAHCEAMWQEILDSS